jgi:hypothetical protein
MFEAAARICGLEVSGVSDPAEVVESESSSPPARRVAWWRRALAAVLVVLGCVLAPLSVLTVWMKTTLLNTDNYVATVGPLADDPAIQNALADRITNTLVEDTASLRQNIVDALPKRAQFIAPHVGDAITGFVHEAALKVVQSDQFSKLWKEANRNAHTRIVAVLEDKGSDTVSTKSGQIAVSLGPMIAKVNQKLHDRGITAFDDAARSASDTQIVLVQSIWLQRAQKITDLLQKLAIVLPIVMALCFGVAIWLSPHRRLTILRSALGVALGMALLLIAFNTGRHYYLGALPGSVNISAAGALYDHLLGALKLALRATFVLALVVALGAWLTGPARSATTIRGDVLGLVRGRGAEGGEPSAFGAWVARNTTILRVLIIAAGLIVLISLSAPTGLSVLVTAILVVVGILLVEFLARRARPTTTAT